MIRVLSVWKKVVSDAWWLNVGLGIRIRKSETIRTSIFRTCSTAIVKNGNSGASVWVYDANHGPGSVVLLFHLWSTLRGILHCRDFKFDVAVFQSHAKQVELIRSGNLEILHLDTKYCNPRYLFQLQRTVLDDMVMLACRKDALIRNLCLFLFGTYSIGEETFYDAVTQALDLHLEACKFERSILDAL